MNRLLSLVLSAAVVFSLAGCGGQASYKVLSFFFDGVPNPAEKKAVREAGGKAGGEGTESPAGGKAGRGSVHGPYAAKMCSGCHDSATRALLLPPRELCYKCHRFRLNKKYIHGPVASGGCIVCHEPHSSGSRFLLVSSQETFCFYCHEKKAIERNNAHKGADMTYCTRCHDAHMSDKKYLLK
jgi:predicted CXXCH cytochrome family protein